MQNKMNLAISFHFTFSTSFFGPFVHFKDTATDFVCPMVIWLSVYGEKEIVSFAIWVCNYIVYLLKKKSVRMEEAKEDVQ